jgi:hypothetical protein
MSESFNKLTPGEVERLVCLTEEASAIVQVVEKILCHGYDSYDPHDPAQMSNRTALEKEIGDLTDRVHLMVSCGDLQRLAIQEFAQQKKVNSKPFMNHPTKATIKAYRS